MSRIDVVTWQVTPLELRLVFSVLLGAATPSDYPAFLSELYYHDTTFDLKDPTCHDELRTYI